MTVIHRSDTHRVSFTFIFDGCEGSPKDTTQEIVDLLFKSPMTRNLGHIMRATTRIVAHEVDEDGGHLMYDTGPDGTDTDYDWSLADGYGGHPDWRVWEQARPLV